MMTAFLALLVHAAFNPAAAPPPPAAALDPVEAMEACRAVIGAPPRGRAFLGSHGWIDRSAGPNVSKDYSEPEAGIFEKGGAIIMFVGKNTTLGRSSPDFPGSCEVVLAGRARNARDLLNQRLGRVLEARTTNGRDISNEWSAMADGQLISVADITQEPGTIRILVAPAPRSRP